MIVWETVIVAFSMFSAIPMPRVDWNARNMRYSLCAFPLVGAVIGLCCWGWAALCAALGLPDLLRGAGLCLLPVLITGGIHLDGFADTCDALASHGDIDKRQAILKDPHLGAFAAIWLCVYFVAALALCASLRRVQPLTLTALFCLSRCLSALALTVYPLRPGSGLARSFADAADRRRVRLSMMMLACALTAVLICLHAWECALTALAVFGYYGRMAERSFGGVSGDLAGWFLQTAELGMLAALCLGQYVRALA